MDIEILWENIAQQLCCIYHNPTKDPFRLIKDPMNLDLGGWLAHILSGNDVELSRFEYEIILLKLVNKLYELQKPLNNPDKMV